MTIPEKCPICSRPSQFLKPVLEDIRIVAKIDDHRKKVFALRAFICTADSHIFFVRAADLDMRAERFAVGRIC